MMHEKHKALRVLACSLLGAFALLVCVGSGTALARGAHWHILATSAPTNLVQGQTGLLSITVVNLGDASVMTPTGDPIVITDVLPAGVEAVSPMGAGVMGGGEQKSSNCSALPQLRCEVTGLIQPFVGLEAGIEVRATKTGSLGENQVNVEGGEDAAPIQEGVAPESEHVPVPTQATRTSLNAGGGTPFGVRSYELTPEQESGATDLQAGSHPFQLTTTLGFNQIYRPNFSNPSFAPGVPAQLKHLYTTLPAGLVANATAIPQCPQVDFLTINQGQSNNCAPNTALGVAVVTFNEPVQAGYRTEAVPIFNLPPQPGEPARLGFEFDTVPMTLDTSIRTGESYAAEVKLSYASQAAEVLGTTVTIWGVPGDERHFESRGWNCVAGGKFVRTRVPRPPCVNPREARPPAYLTQPTTPCTQPLASSVRAQSWEPGAPLLGPLAAINPPTLEGCSGLSFAPQLTVRPDRTEASTPTGLNVEVTMPLTKTLSARGPAEADIRDTTLRLPPGMLSNPGSADGLAVCSPEEAGLGEPGLPLQSQLAAQQFAPAAVSCLDAAKVGSVNIKTPLLERELTGYVYFGSQNTNPFAAPLVLYLIAEDALSGVRVKLAGEVTLNPGNRQIESVFRNAPPLPFEKLKLHLYDGPRATQSTPAHCASYESSATLTNGSEVAPVQSSSSFTTTPNADGQPCPAGGSLPFAPGFLAGSTSSQAGGFSSFTVSIARPDGDAALKTISVKLPPGLAAVLASVTPCPEPQAAQGTCGPESLIGHSNALAGLGPNPVSLPGNVYLTAPYNGAPFGLSAVTFAHVGPFNLGRIVARASINIDRDTAAATIDTTASQFFALSPVAGEQASSAGLPEILKGTPAQIKALNVTIDRAGFQFNPTNCSPLAVSGTLPGYEGVSAAVSTPFRAANCASLPFKPKLTVSVGKTFGRVNGVSFIVRVSSTHGQANIAKTRLVIPKALPSRLTTIQKACLDSVFKSTFTPGSACGEGSNIGRAVVRTPVLRGPLEGPAYLVSHGGAAFPDVEFVLKGENGILLVLDGHTNIKNGVTTSTFNAVPDAPVESFEAILPAGPHSALTVYAPGRSTLCGTALVAPTTITGQNGRVIEQATPVAVEGCTGVAGFRKAETRARKLARALAACRKNRNPSRRRSCERTARRLYGPRAPGHGRRR